MDPGLFPQSSSAPVPRSSKKPKTLRWSRIFYHLQMLPICIANCLERYTLHMPHERDCVEKARKLLRRGYFAFAASDQRLISDLRDIDRGRDKQLSLRWLNAQCLLAEIHDQTADYKEVSRIVSFGDDPSVTMKRLRGERDRLSRRGSTAPNDDERRLIRAQGMWVLQCAVARLRRFELDIGLRLMSECQDVIEGFHTTPMRFHGLLSLLHFWQGRVLILKNDRVRARDHFHLSMQETENNLEFHLAGQDFAVMQRDDRVTFAVHNLASCMAFGLAQLSHSTGGLKEAVNLLHPALAMFMSTGDNYRRGGALMMMGAAERALAGVSPESLAKAIERLNAALHLLGPKPNRNIAHALHEARAHYQLSLAWLYSAQGLHPPGVSSSELSKEATDGIARALSHNKQAWERLSGYDELGDYADPQLKSDVLIIRSRIYRYQRQYTQAWEQADAALQQVRDYSYAEPSGRANSLIARGEALVAQAADLELAVPKARRDQLLERAQNDFAQAAAIAGKATTVTGVAGMHVANILAMRGDLPHARVQFQQAWLMIQRIENGWVHRLAQEVRQRVELPSSIFMLDIKQVEKALGDGIGLYDAVEASLRDFMVKRSQTMDGGAPRSPDEAARYLGKSRPTYYTWLRKSEPADKPKRARAKGASE